MTVDEIIERIEHHYLTLTDESKHELVKVSKMLTLDKETILVKEGQFADKTYFIVQGSARAYYLKDGKDITDWFAFENDFIISINSFFLGKPSAHYIETVEPSTLLEVSTDDIALFSERYREIDKLGKLVITKTMLQLQQRVVSIQFETALQKYENLVRIRPDITQRVPLTHIASYLGMTLETLSRIRKPERRI